jgi:hypothetical protein
MRELFLLIAIMVATVVLMAGMMFPFKGYFDQRAKIDRDAGRYRPGPSVAPRRSDRRGASRGGHRTH